ncbi:UNVERIFIED_CONTAM: hypothetical protein RMT77_008288 [Armadillidium vulgare]
MSKAEISPLFVSVILKGIKMLFLNAIIYEKYGNDFSEMNFSTAYVEIYFYFTFSLGYSIFDGLILIKSFNSLFAALSWLLLTLTTLYHTVALTPFLLGSENIIAYAKGSELCLY